MTEQIFQQAAESFGAGDLERAERLCEELLAGVPDHADALHLLGVSRLRGGRATEAVAPLRNALRADPGNLAILDALSAALAAAGEFQEAERATRQLLAQDSNVAIVHARLGNVLASQQRWSEARDALEKALALEPRYVPGHCSLAEVLLHLQRPEEALAAAGRALQLDSRRAEAHNAEGLALMEVGRAEDAVGAFQKSLALNGASVPAQRNLGRALLECGRVEEARQQFEQVILAEGDTAIVRCDLGACLQELGRWGEAEKCHERALAIDPDFSGAAYNLALTRLYQRKYETAWPLYERRFESAGMRERLRRDPRSVSLFEGQRRWKGPEDRVEGGVAIWAEQGLGDQVLHSTLIPELVDAGVPFVYEVDIRMLPAYERSFGKGRFVPWNEPPNEALLQCGAALMAGSLPGWFRRNRESFMRQPQRLLAAAPGRVAHYRGRIDALGAGLKVALSWCSRRADRLGPRKSVPLTALAPLLRVPGTTFVDVQYGDTGPERNSVMAETGVRLHRLEDVDFLNDLEDVLAVIEACDLLITTSNATAHLAGALGKRTWLLVLSENPPFPYWSHDGGHRSDWYPAVEVLSRKDLETWPELVRYGARRLEALSSNSSR